MLEMKLNDIEKEYIEAKDKKSQIGILADLNGVESTFMALLLREMGNDVDSMKLPRKQRNGGADAYELFQLTQEYAEAVKYRTERGREIGRAIGYNAKERKKGCGENGTRNETAGIGKRAGNKERRAAHGDLYVGSVHGIPIRSDGNQGRYGNA